ncbi:tail fiber assembly protein [Providencia rettgeri]
MNYFQDRKTNEVFAYSDEQLQQVERISILEQGLEQKEVLLNSDEYLKIQYEYDNILPIFFDIREKLNELKEMTQKEVDVHLNPPIPKAQLIAGAEQKKQSLLAEANNAIAPLQYAQNLGISTAEESASLVDWQKYSVYLNRIDTSLAPDIDWPEKPE